MKKFILLSLLIYLFNTDFLFSQWVSYSNGITHTSYCYLSNTDNKLFAANSEGLFSSTNEGIKWQKLTLNADLNFFMKNNTYLYSGGYGGLYLSSNDGVNWIKVINSNTNTVVTSGSNLYAAVQNNGVLKSTNNGFNWVPSYVSYWNPVTTLAIKDNYLFAGLSSGEYSPGQVIYSTNGGNNWSSTGLDSVSVTALYVKDQYLFAGTYSNGLYRSTDNGNNWVNISINTFPVRFIKSIENVLYVSSGVAYSEYNGLFKSTNSGNNWTQINIPVRNNCAVSVEKINNTLVTALEAGGIFLSYDNGINWVHYLHENSTISKLYSFNSRLFAGVINEGIYYSDDNGENWIQSKLNHINVYDFTSNGSAIFAGTDRYTNYDTGGVFISTDNGINWNITNLRAKIINALNCFNSKFYAGAAYEGIYTSTNNGINWVHLTSLPGCVPYCFFQRGGKIFSGMFRDNHYQTTGLYFTTNNGSSWDSVMGIKSVGRISANSNYLFGSCNDSSGPIRSSNEGVSWITTSLLKGTWDVITNNNYVFAGTTMNGIYMSSDNGTTWRAKNEGILNNNIHGLLIYNGFIFAGSYGKGIYRRTIQDITEVKQNCTEIPENFSLSQNYPNPFNPNTIIRFQIKDSRFVTLKIYDILGKEIATLVNEKQSPGTYEVSWDGSAYPSGVYFYKLISGDFTVTKKMLMIK
jgi:photosystem II stability/assembly factor-like uncharacterized protein